METDMNIFQDDDGKFCLTIMDPDDKTAALFEKRDLQGWEDIVTALVQAAIKHAGGELE